MGLTGPQIISLLRENRKVEIGRHLYGVLGVYEHLARFEREHLCHAGPDGALANTAVNVNQALLSRIGDDDLRELVRSEARRPQTIKRRLHQEFDALLAGLLKENPFLVLKQIELLFAYDLELEVIRARATNQNHILLLLPGEKRGEHVTLFAEASSRFHRILPYQLIADNHLWELENGE